MQSGWEGGSLPAMNAWEMFDYVDILAAARSIYLPEGKFDMIFAQNLRAKPYIEAKGYIDRAANIDAPKVLTGPGSCRSTGRGS